MRVAIYKGERNLSDLVGRLFHVKDRTASALAESRLLERNPHLHDLTRLSEGTPILIPESEDLKDSSEAEPVGVTRNEVLEWARRLKASVHTTAEASVAAQVNEAKELLELLTSKELKTASRSDPDIRERTAKMTEENKARLKEAQAMKNHQEKALAQLDHDVDSLVRRWL